MHTRLLQRFLFISGLISISLGFLLVAAHLAPKPEPLLGVSFSAMYAEELGLDPEETLEAILDELKPAKVRLMSYWDRHETALGEYDFAELDWQFALAHEHGTPVLLAMGQRQPRWPECHIPTWAQELETEAYRTALNTYLAVVADRYKNEPLLRGYHLENEAANRAFGICPTFSSAQLKSSFKTIKEVDPHTPITLSASNQYGIPIQPPIGDEYAFSIYRQAYFQLWGRQVHWDYSFVPAAWHRLRTWAIAVIHNRPSYVHELQTEPWGEQATSRLTIEQQDASMNKNRISENVAYARDIGTDAIFLWGGEWWYWRYTQFGDEALWSHMRDNIFAEAPAL